MNIWLMTSVNLLHRMLRFSSTAQKMKAKRWCIVGIANMVTLDAVPIMRLYSSMNIYCALLLSLNMKEKQGICD